MLLFKREARGRNFGESTAACFGTVLSALFDDDTHDVLLFTREARGTFRWRAHGGPFGTVLSALFDDDAHDVLPFARETRVAERPANSQRFWIGEG